MKKVLLFALLSCASLFSKSQKFTPVDASSSVKFVIKNLGSTVTGTFKGLQGSIIFNATAIASSAFNVSVDATTVNTNNGARDKHLKKEDYFNVVGYPRISIISTKISTSSKSGVYNMDANVSIKGVVKAISFPFTAVAQADGYLFVGEFNLNRRDFNVGGSSWILSDNLTVSLSVFVKKN